MGFYRTADPFERSQLHYTELTYGYCDFSATVDSLAKWTELGGAEREKLSGSETLGFVYPCSLCVCSWLRSRIRPLRRRRQSGHAAETAGAAHPPPQQSSQQLANA